MICTQKRREGSALNYLFWNNQRLAGYYNGPGDQTDDELCLRYANEALSLLPTLQRGEIPHYDELCARVLRALTMSIMSDYEAALVEYKVCLAAIRLLHHAGRLDMNDPNVPLMDDVNLWPHTIMRMTIKVKMQNGRPYLTKDEYLDLMKENAYGIYSPSSQKCFNCDETINLLLCAGCSNAWYCGKSCAKKDWKTEHKHRCRSKKYSGTYTLPAPFFQEFLKEIESKDGKGMTDNKNSMGMSIIHLGDDRDFLVLCKDPISGEIFDAPTDEASEFQEGPTLPFLKSNLGGYYQFQGIPANPSQSESQE